MARKKRDPQDDSSQKKILDAAEKIFADKGYFGARVGEIGKAAGVNPALLYYYFDNKEDILNKLLSNAVDETNRLLDTLIQEIQGPESINENLLNYMIDRIIDFFRSRRNLLKIMIVEMMNTDQKNTHFLDFIMPLMDKVEEKKEALTVFKKDQASFRTNMFYHLTAPLLFYITIGESWEKYSGIDQEYTRVKLREVISQMMLREIYIPEGQ